LERADALRNVEVEGLPAWTEWDDLQGFVEEDFAALFVRISRSSFTQAGERTMIEQSTTIRLMSKSLLGSNVDLGSLSIWLMPTTCIQISPGTPIRSWAVLETNSSSVEDRDANLAD
jgi:hypothetical protein